MKERKTLAAGIAQVVQAKLDESGEQPKSVKKAIQKSADKLSKKLTKIFKKADKKLKKAQKKEKSEKKEVLLITPGIPV